MDSVVTPIEMSKQDTIIRFKDVTFKYPQEKQDKLILDSVNFNVRRFAKITIMGQNGAGKSTLFKLLTGKLQPNSGEIHIDQTARIAIAEQMVPEDKLDLSVKEYFESCFEEKVHGIEKNIAEVLDIVNLKIDLEKKVRDLSGGQKARILLAGALIQEPDILLLDEPTNNLDDTGIEHLTEFLKYYWNTVIVISHDADFLNEFTDGVLNLDSRAHKVEQFVGNYFDVLNQIEAHIEKQRLLNARIEKSVKDRFEKVNKLGGKSVAMRRLAKKVRAEIEEDRENMVEVRKDDKTIPEFEIPTQHIPRPVVTINEVQYLKNFEVQTAEVNYELRRGETLLISGPNGIGKSTLLKSILNGQGAKIDPDVRVGYYSQDFAELDFEDTAYESLAGVALEQNPEKIYGAAGRFLLNGELLNNKVGSLSEGQKGLLCYARFMLQEPGLLIMDEPTNHINFRHLPVIAKAIQDFKGALVLISHMKDFVEQVEIDFELDLTKL